MYTVDTHLPAASAGDPPARRDPATTSGAALVLAVAGVSPSSAMALAPDPPPCLIGLRTGDAVWLVRVGPVLLLAIAAELGLHGMIAGSPLEGGRPPLLPASLPAPPDGTPCPDTLSTP